MCQFKRFLLFAIIVGVAFSLFPSTGQACSCSAPSPQQAYAKSDVVIVAEVKAFTRKRFKRRLYPALVLKVAQVWKGDAPKDMVAFFSDVPGWCGDLNLATGKRYVLYAQRRNHLDGALVVMGDCWRGPRVDLAGDDFKFLNTLSGPREPS